MHCYKTYKISKKSGMIRQIQDIKDKRNTVYIVKNIIEHPIFKKDNYANCKNCHEKDILIVELID